MAYKHFPSQKKPLSLKTEQWKKDCIDGAEALAIFRDEGLRKSYRTKRINYNLYSDILDQDDIRQMIDPMNLSNSYSPARAQNYPIANPKIDLLCGEETKRNFDWRLRSVNEDAISEKEKHLNDRLTQVIVEQIKAEAIDEEDLKKRLSEFEHYKNYTYQDKAEVAGTWILRHLWEEQRMKQKFDKGFKDALIAGEEIYQWDIIAGQPVLIKHNPLNVHTVRSGESPFIEDSEIIVIDSYYPPGKIIDEYNEYLTDKQIDQIEEKSLKISGSGSSEHPDLMLDRRDMLDEVIDTAVLESGLNEYASPFDENGNIRVLKVYWKTMRKMQKIKYYDNNGDEQYELMPEQYKANKDLGEESTTLWISEWMEGHKIGAGYSSDDCIGYVKMQVRPVQFRRMENPSICSPGIIGTIYNTNDNVSMSLMDRMKPYQYMYNVLMYQVELMLATNWGKILKMNVAEIPDGWDVEKWLHYGKYLKVVPYDPFKEGKKGAALGKIAGNLTSSNANPVIDMSQGNAIQLYISMMEHIKNELGEIAGVSRAREGQISPSSTSGNVQREIIQSSHTTEYYFAEHADVKKRVMIAGLDTAKIAWQNSKTKKLQYVSDDMATQLINISMEDIASIDFDMFVSNSREDAELRENLKQLAHAGIQNDKVNFTQLIDIFTSPSLSSIRRKLEKGEAEKAERDQKQSEQAERIQQQQIQAAKEAKERDYEHDREMETIKGQNAATLESLKSQLNNINKGFDVDKDGIRDDVELIKAQIQRDAESLENDKQRNHESSENEKERQNKKELERIKNSNKQNNKN